MSGIRRRSIDLAALSLTLALLPRPASAHFFLRSPPAATSQDLLGSPQKLGPCGDEPGGTPTGIVTTFRPGQKITVTIDEVIPHPGHYRIALAVNDRSELPPEPVVTPDTTACGSAPIQNPPVFPVLADGVFPHTEAFTEPQSIEITLPSDVSCTHCTLQVIEFMSNHGLNDPGGCYYHHCADLSIQPEGSERQAGCVSAAPSVLTPFLLASVLALRYLRRKRQSAELLVPVSEG